MIEPGGEHLAPPPPALDAFPRAPQRSERPPADETSLAAGSWLGIDPYPITAEAAARYLADAHESLPIYAEEGLIHPRDILRGGNFVLSRNVVLGPWIHVGSQIQHFGTAPVGTSLAARAHITANYEHKAHRFVELDVLVLADDAKPIARLAHTAIYRPRQVIAA